MSVHYSSAVWKAKIKDPIAKLVLLKLADNANDAGKCWPSIAKISEETGLCRRTVQTKIRSLEDLKLLKSVRGVNRCDYTLSIKNLSEITQKEGVQEMQGAGDAGCISRHEGVQEMHGGGAGDALAYKEPSLNRQRTKEPKKPVYDLPFQTPKFNEAWTTWLEHRKEIKKPVTTQSAKMTLNKLATMDENQAIESINQSIRNGWIGIFPVKQDQPRPTNEPFNHKAKRNGFRPFD